MLAAGSQGLSLVSPSDAFKGSSPKSPNSFRICAHAFRMFCSIVDTLVSTSIYSYIVDTVVDTLFPIVQWETRSQYKWYYSANARLEVRKGTRMSNVITMWLPCDCYVITMWLLRDYYVIAMWLLCDYHVITMWLLCDYYVITMWKYVKALE